MVKKEIIKYTVYLPIFMPKHKKLYIYTDGGCRGNPGPGAVAVVIFDKDRNIIVEHKECVGETTNNRAEYMALIKALELATGHCRKEVLCFLDSELVVRQLSGRYAIKNKKLLELFHILKDRERAFEKVTYNHTRRNNPHILIADNLVNEALNNNK